MYHIKNRMRVVLLIILLLSTIGLYSQIEITGVVKDAKTKEPLIYCNIAVKGTAKGTITNTDGVFIISVDYPKDVLIISYLGYETISKPAESILNQKIILLSKNNIALQEVTVLPDNDFLYDILEKCRNNLINNKSNSTCKVFYTMETSSKTISLEYPPDKTIYYFSDSLESEIPVELLECFYNGNLNGVKVQELLFKSGRTAIASADNYFLTLNSSKAISKISLFDKNDYFPTIPLQLKKNNLRKSFQLELIQADSGFYQIGFSSISTDGFSGAIWIEPKTFNLLKVTLKAENTTIHPFSPIFSSDTIKDVSFDITAIYKKTSNSSVPDHIYFNYNFTYCSRRDSSVGLHNERWKKLTRVIHSNGMMYFYDIGKPFILPYFNYSDFFDDYNKMSFIPYNETFWKNNNILLLTENQKKNFDIIAKNGQNINFQIMHDRNSALSYLNFTDYGKFFEFYYAFWSSHKRIVPNTSSPQFELYSKERISRHIRSDLYQIKVQILLDIVESGDSLLCNTHTVFDNEQTFYHLPINQYTNAFINIYFDICEIERRKMQRAFDSGRYSLTQIDSIYNETQKNILNITSTYQNEVDLGENEEKFQKWNLYVMRNLNIDNIKMVEESIKK
jgi:hypothetical protein